MIQTGNGPALRRPLVLTGGPAVGKTSTGKALASARPRAAFVDVDDVRQLIVSGGEPPWRGKEGRARQELGVRNACGMARRFTGSGFDVVIADVVTPGTASVYRQELPRCLLMHLVVPLEEALRRASTRRVWLTDHLATPHRTIDRLPRMWLRGWQRVGRANTRRHSRRAAVVAWSALIVQQQRPSCLYQRHHTVQVH